MKSPYAVRFFVFIFILITTTGIFAQQPTAEDAREKTRARMSALLQRIGPEIKVGFQVSPKSQYVFTGVMQDGLTNSEKLEIVITVTTKDTIGFKIFPHYKGGYINIDKARNSTQLLRKLLQLNESTFLFWGADETGDVFTGYTFTLESGFPDEAIKIVLSSIRNSDQFVGQLRPSIDGSSAQ